MSAEVAAGTMRSTMVDGKATLASTQRASAGDRATTKSASTVRSSAPFAGMLSQLKTLRPGAPLTRRRSKAAASSPSAVPGEP